MSEGSAPTGPRTITSAVLAAALFTAACAVFAITFVAARGGLTMPVAASLAPVAQASENPSGEPSAEPSTPAASLVPPPSSDPTLPPTAEPTPPPVLPSPTPEPSPGVRPTLEPGDPLLALRECPAHPGCFEYVVQRFESLSQIISRYRLDYDVLVALNPSLVNPNLIVTGQTLLLARDPFVLLDPCPAGEACVLYVVRAGDSVAEIAGRYGLDRDVIVAANPEMPRPIVAGQVIKLPLTP